MATFRRVDGAEAGPDALGILVPPGRRTLVILRPRALDYDLVPLQPPTDDGLAPDFAEIDHKEAPGVSQRLYRALEAASASKTGRVEAVPAVGAGWWVRARAGAFTLLACLRVPGEAYQPAVLATGAEASALAARLAPILFPAPDDSQELYFNTRHFGR